MLYTRYDYAAELGRRRRVLELGCGSGQGFGLVGWGAARLVGGDLSAPLLHRAPAHYGRRVSLVRLSVRDFKVIYVTARKPIRGEAARA